MSSRPTTTDLLSAIVLFTRGPRGEASAKRVIGGRSIEREFWGEICQHLAGIAHPSADNVLVVSPEKLDLGEAWLPQRGSTFFERLVNAEKAARTVVSGSVAILAGDIPAVTARHLATTAGILAGSERRVVLGPSPDGGVYLIASSESVIERLEGVRWSTSTVARDIAAILTREGFEVCWLEMLSDIDSRSDLEKNFASLSFLSAALRDLIAAALRNSVPTVTVAAPAFHASAVPQLRAPPAIRSLRQ